MVGLAEWMAYSMLPLVALHIHVGMRYCGSTVYMSSGVGGCTFISGSLQLPH